MQHDEVVGGDALGGSKRTVTRNRPDGIRISPIRYALKVIFGESILRQPCAERIAEANDGLRMAICEAFNRPGAANQEALDRKSGGESRVGREIRELDRVRHVSHPAHNVSGQGEGWRRT